MQSAEGHINHTSCKTLTALARRSLVYSPHLLQQRCSDTDLSLIFRRCRKLKGK
jgi:hypothetical protein